MTLEIDGNYGEGGGSIVRLATAFSVLTNKTIQIKRIRHNRPKPGLKHQHFIGLELLKEISSATTSELKEGDTELFFSPGELRPGIYKKSIRTAGSIGLIIQLLQIALARSNKEFCFIIDGGATFGKWAPSLPYLEKVTFSNFKRIGLDINVKIIKHGFYPKGGAKAEIKIKGNQELKGLNLNKLGKIQEINCLSFASTRLEKAKVADRQFSSLKRYIQKKLNVDVIGDVKYVETLNPGSGICAWAISSEGSIIGSDFIGEKKLRSEIVGENCAKKITETILSKATVDHFQSDQLIPFMFLTEEPFIFKVKHVTNHVTTNIWLGKQFFHRNIKIKKDNSCYRILANG
ncbi:MAG: RNA 3'-terminal phosphate cyclase [Candidatus Helarchaeota archaeon]